METKDLHAIWSAPDNSQLTSKQYTVRVPIRVAAQLGRNWGNVPSEDHDGINRRSSSKCLRPIR